MLEILKAIPIKMPPVDPGGIFTLLCIKQHYKLIFAKLTMFTNYPVTLNNLFTRYRKNRV